MVYESRKSRFCGARERLGSGGLAGDGFGGEGKGWNQLPGGFLGHSMFVIRNWFSGVGSDRFCRS